MVIEKDPIEHRSKGKIAVLRTKNGFLVVLASVDVGKFMAIQLDGQSLNDILASMKIDILYLLLKFFQVRFVRLS